MNQPSPLPSSWPRGARARIVATLVLAAAVLVAIGWYAQRSLQHTLAAAVRAELTTLLEVDIAALRIWAEAQQAAAEAIATDDQLTALVAAVRDGAPDDPLAAYLAPILRSRRMTGFTLLDAAGDELTSVRLAGQAAVDARDLRRALAASPDDQGAVLTRPVLATGGAPVMFAAAPVPAADRAPTLLALHLDPDDDFARILAIARSGDTGETFAFDESATLLSPSRRASELRALGIIGPAQQARLRVPLRVPGAADAGATAGPLTAMAARATRGEAGVDVDGYLSYHGERVVGAWTWLAEYGFGVATEVAYEEAFAAQELVRKTFWVLFMLLAAAALGIAIVSALVATFRARVSAAHIARRLGPYTLVEKLGDGGMGTVYRAQHALLRRPTAVKLVRPDRADARAFERFEREVQMTSRLTHPNTIAVFDYGHTPEGIFYYAMEYLEGVDLDLLVTEFGPQPPARVLRLLEQVCGSLAEAHGIGLIHRDIKPANIMVCERGGEHDVVQVLDFGLVKDATSESDPHDQRLAGTPLYMAPEAVRDPASVGPASDLYAVGLVGYFLLTGTPTFRARTVAEVRRLHLEEPPESPSARLAAPVPADLEALLLACLSKDPDDRPASARDLRDALHACVDAGTWDESRAARWWADNRLRVIASRARPRTSGDHERSLVVDETRRG